MLKIVVKLFFEKNFAYRKIIFFFPFLISPMKSFLNNHSIPIGVRETEIKFLGLNLLRINFGEA